MLDHLRHNETKGRAGATVATAAKRPAGALAVLAALFALLAVAFACALALPQASYAAVSKGALGLELEVPSTVQQLPGSEPGGPSGSNGGLSGTPGSLGLELIVPTTSEDDGADVAQGSAGGASTVPGTLGLELEIPSTVQQAGSDPENPDPSASAGQSGSPGFLGLEMEVPSTSEDDGENQGVGSTGGASTVGGTLGLELEVPSTVQQVTGSQTDGASGSEGVLGIEMEVPTGLMVELNANGGLGTRSIPAEFDKPIPAPNNDEFTWPGRSVEYWSTESDPAKQSYDDRWEFDDGAGGGDRVKDTLTLYAHWKVEGLENSGVTLNLMKPDNVDNVWIDQGNDGNDAPVDAAKGEEKREAENHGIYGKFNNDSDPTTGKSHYVNDVECYGYGEVTDNAQSDPDVIYEGRYFEGGGAGPEVGDASKQDYEDEDATLELPTPSISRGVFDGWYTNPSYSGNPVEKIDRFATGDVEYYAKWHVVDLYTVTFDGGEAAAAGATVQGLPDPVKVESGQLLARPSETPKWDDEHLFSGWYADPGCTREYNFSNPVRYNITLYAGWKPMVYEVHFDSNGGNESYKAAQVASGTTVPKPADPTRGGHRFGGWFTEKAGGSEWNFDTALNKDNAPGTLYAHWVEQVTVTFSMGGAPASVRPVESQTFDKGGNATKPTINGSWEGHVFEGWYSDAACTTEFDFGAAVNSSCTVYAKWIELAADEFAVTFDSRGGSAVVGSPFKVKSGDVVSAPADPTRDGYDFGGWFTDAACLNGYDFATPVTSSFTLYAKWTPVSGPGPVEEKFTVTFDANGGEWPADGGSGGGSGEGGSAGSAVTTITQTVVKGSSATEPEVDPAWISTDEAPTMYFTGWWTARTGGTLYGFTESVDADVTLYAQWSSDESDWIRGKDYTFVFEDGVEDPLPESDGMDIVGGMDSVRNASVAKRSGNAIDDIVDEVLTDEDGNAIVPTRRGFVFAGFWAEVPQKDGDSSVKKHLTQMYFDLEYEKSYDVPVGEEPDGADATGEYVMVPRWVVNDRFLAADGTTHVWSRTMDAVETDEVGEDGQPTGEKINTVHLVAKWDMHLDVTVPMSVTFAVNAADASVITPDADRYAMRSRTISPVTVDAIELDSDLEELRGFFEKKGVLTDAATAAGKTSSDSDLDYEGIELSNALDMEDTTLWLVTKDALSDPAYLDAASKGEAPKADAAWSAVFKLAEGGSLEQELVLDASKKGLFKMDAFDVWSYGADASKSNDLPMKFGLKVDDELKVKLYGDASRPITHMKVTVSAPAK